MRNFVMKSNKIPSYSLLSRKPLREARRSFYFPIVNSSR